MSDISPRKVRTVNSMSNKDFADHLTKLLVGNKFSSDDRFGAITLKEPSPLPRSVTEAHLTPLYHQLCKETWPTDEEIAAELARESFAQQFVRTLNEVDLQYVSFDSHAIEGLYHTGDINPYSFKFENYYHPHIVVSHRRPSWWRRLWKRNRK